MTPTLVKPLVHAVLRVFRADSDYMVPVGRPFSFTFALGLGSQERTQLRLSSVKIGECLGTTGLMESKVKRIPHDVRLDLGSKKDSRKLIRVRIERKARIDSSFLGILLSL
ncbi:hypothetical protein VNO77_03193 [Canavalia gladiata]|uniref:Uncharacterized protein n=1 Tax=Canavalia gladiata TaxID=3824 RepID=A0AAN9MZX9_CANGL